MMKNAKQIAVAALALCALCVAAAAAPSGSPVDKNGQLSVKNGQIVNKNNEPVALRGMSFFWSNPGWEGAKYYNSNVVGWLTDDWKVDIVRAAMNPSERGDWQKVVDAAIDKGIYVIIDWHSHNAHNQTNDAKTFFSTQAGKYKDTPNVLYEIYNEPCPSGQQSGACAGDDWATQVRPYAQAVVDEIRKTDTKNIILIGSADYSKRGDLATVNPVSGSNLAYSVHYYTAEPGTNHQSELRAWCNTALTRGYALLVTEFGLSEADGGNQTNKKCPNWITIPECAANPNGNYNNTNKIDTTEANLWFNYLDQNYVGWVNWSIVDKNEAASALAGGAGSGGNWSDNNLRPSGRFIRNKLRLYAENRTITIDKKGQGAVTVSVGSTAGNVTTVRYGTPVTLTAVPSSGWMFEGWTGSKSGMAATLSLSPVYSNLSITANFAEGSMIKNGTFTNDITEWTANGAKLSREPADGGSLKAEVQANGGSTFRVQTSGYGIKIEAGKKYTLSFRAKTSSGTKSITPRITNSNRNLNYMDTAAVTITSTWKTEEKTFTASASDESAVLLFACGGYSDAWDWWLDDVKLNLVGGTPVMFNPAAAAPARTSWSISKTGGVLQLRGPVEAGARVSLYDTRGKIVKSMAAKDGLTLNATGVPAGSYIAVVKNRNGADVYRSRVSFVK